MTVNVLNRITKLEAKLNTNKPQVFFIDRRNKNEWEVIKNGNVIAKGKTPEQVESELIKKYGDTNINIFIDDVPTDD